MGLSRTYLLKGFNNTFFKAHYKYIVDLAVFYGADKSRAEKEIKESLLFEASLANVREFLGIEWLKTKFFEILDFVAK